MKSSVLRSIVVILMMSVVLAGCKNIQLIPKKKEEVATAKRYVSVHEYDVHPSLDLYTKRYVYWKNWHRELLSLFGDRAHQKNEKKFIVSVEQEVSNLIDMRDMLVDEKADQLQIQIDKLTKVEMAIKTEGITEGNSTRLRREITRVGKLVKKNFTYRKMKPYISANFREQDDDQI